MDTTTTTEYDEMRDTLKGVAHDLSRLVHHAYDEDETCDQAAIEEARETLDNYGLDFYVTGEKRGDEWTATGWVLLIATGDPHYELRSDGYLHGWGWFGAGACQYPVSAGVTDYFEQWAEMA